MRHHIISLTLLTFGIAFFLITPSDAGPSGAAAMEVKGEVSTSTDNPQDKSQEANVDFSGVEKFLELTAILEDAL